MTGARCQYAANKMTVKLGKDSTVQSRNMIRFSPSLSLRQYGSSSVPVKDSTLQKGYFIKVKQSQVSEFITASIILDVNMGLNRKITFTKLVIK